MQVDSTVWSQDWERFDHIRSEKNSENNMMTELSDEEFVEYLRWMACNRPQKYIHLMTAFAEQQNMRKQAIAV
ncbi:MAG: hypothetical protein K6F00_03580 [Lachnospiraceae bacterium]|nr:hypothetical protein [Lachnospiraceae bacterium]